MIPTEGLHDGVPMEKYHREWAAVSKSQLQHLLRSPAHLEAYLADDAPPTTAQQKAYDFGTAVHLAALEPDLFYETVAPKPPGHPSSRAYKQAVKAMKAKNPDVILLTPQEYERVQGAGDAIQAHDQIRRALKHSRTEVSACWTDPTTKLLCKGRADAWNERSGIIVDLKTARDARREAFRRQVHQLGYAMQAAFYLTGWDVLGHSDVAFLFVAVEKAPPYGVCLYEMSPAWLTHAETLIDALLDLYSVCKEADRWPAYDADIQELDMAEWQSADMEASVRRLDAIRESIPS